MWRSRGGLTAKIHAPVDASGNPIVLKLKVPPGTNGIVERFHKTVLDEFYRVAFRRKVYDSIETLQADLDAWIEHYNEVRTHQGRYCFGKTPMQTFLDAKQIAQDKQIGGQMPHHMAA